jgi:hypothetical protein
VPAGFTFGIWGIIYILLIGFVIFSIAISFGSGDAASEKIMQAISFPFQVTCLLNAGWILAWHYLQLGFSLVIMVGLLVFLCKIFIRIQKIERPSRASYIFWLQQPFIVYLAWISVATIANVTALLVGIGWQGGFLSPAVWSTAMIIIGFALGIYFILRYKQYGYAFVLSWAFFGIYSSQVNLSKLVGYTALFACSALLALSVIRIIDRRKLD